jgi:surface protein
MFSHCKNLFELNISSLNIREATNINNIFSFCENLTRVLINKINVKKIKNEIDNTKLKI